MSSITHRQLYLNHNHHHKKVIKKKIFKDLESMSRAVADGGGGDTPKEKEIRGNRGRKVTWVVDVFLNFFVCQRIEKLCNPSPARESWIRHCRYKLGVTFFVCNQVQVLHSVNNYFLNMFPESLSTCVHFLFFSLESRDHVSVPSNPTLIYTRGVTPFFWRGSWIRE